MYFKFTVKYGRKHYSFCVFQCYQYTGTDLKLPMIWLAMTTKSPVIRVKYAKLYFAKSQSFQICYITLFLRRLWFLVHAFCTLVTCIDPFCFLFFFSFPRRTFFFDLILNVMVEMFVLVLFCFFKLLAQKSSERWRLA